jgi:UDP-N-acetylmuramyl pentapeptide synthase
MEMQGIGTFGAVHNCHNALIAAVAATELGKGFSDSIAQICKYVSPLRDRFFIEKMGKHLLIDDTYNANPSSFSSAINDLSNNSAYPKNKLLVIGDMLELGEFSREEHLRILNESLKVPGLKALFIEGNRFKKALFERGHNREEEKIFVIDSQESFPIELISQFLDEETTILVKGSRGLKMERIISLFVENFS